MRRCDFMHLEYLLFDLDNTLYHASSGLFEEISRRMTRFVAEYFGIPEQKASIWRKEYSSIYGTTLGGLMQAGGLDDPEQFILDVHPTDIDKYVPENPGLKLLLESVNLPKSILTNSPLEHARRVLSRLGVSDCFEKIFDIRFSGFQGKPVPECYMRVCKVIGKKSGEVLFIDDLPQYLEAFRDLGGEVLLVSEDGKGEEAGFPKISEIGQLPGYLRNTYGLF